MFYVYVVDKRFVKIGKELQRGLTKNIGAASYWTNKSRAKTWERTIKAKYPNAKLEEAVLTLKINEL